MSLRRKILLLFGLFAVVPLLTVAGVSYWQARSLLLGMVQDQAEEAAMAAADDLAARGRGIESELAFMARYAPPSPSERAEWAPNADPVADSLLALAAFVGSRDTDGTLGAFVGSIPEDRSRCVGGIESRLVTFSVPLESTPGARTLEAGFWVSDLVSFPELGQESLMLRVDGDDGSVLLAAGCGLNASTSLENESPVTRNVESTPTIANRLEDSDAGRRWRSSVAAVDGMGWRVTALASASEALNPLKRLTLLYWAFVLGLSFFTAVAFSLILGRFTRSLSELVRAAEEIGAGELDPWLPLHTNGELGRLTWAFSRMLDRVRENMKQVDQSGRLAVLGQLSAYLAHEIRNPLSSIKMNLQRLSRWTRAGELPDYCKEPLEISLKEVERLNTSVTGVLQLSRAGEGPREIVGLHEVLGEATELMATRFKNQCVGLSLELDANADFVLARPGQLKSVALNLMMNALEAQPEGGHLEIRTSLVGSPELLGPAVSIHFKDEGPGVPFGMRDHIFEPFFTTKNGGSGIGLAMARQAVEDSGGRITLAPTVPTASGAEFIMVFPLASFESTQFGSRPPGSRYSTSSTPAPRVVYHASGKSMNPDASELEEPSIAEAQGVLPQTVATPEDTK